MILRAYSAGALFVNIFVIRIVIFVGRFEMKSELKAVAERKNKVNAKRLINVILYKNPFVPNFFIVK